MAIVKTIDIAIRATTSTFEAGLKKAQGTLANFSRSVGGIASGIPGLDAVTSKLGMLAGTAGPLVAVGSALAGIGVAIKHAMSEIDRVADVSLELGIDPNELLALEHAANAAGVGVDKLQSGLQRMTVEAAEAVAGSKSAQKTFQALGLDATKMAKAAPDAALRALADAFQAIDSPSEKARLAVDLFGRQGIQMLRMLSEGSAGLEEFRQRSISLGNTIDSKGVAAVNNWKNAWADIKSTFNSVSQDIFGVAEGPVNVLSAAVSKMATGVTFLSKVFLQADAHAASVAAGWIEVASAGEVASASLTKTTSAAQLLIEKWTKAREASNLKAAIAESEKKTQEWESTLKRTMDGFRNDADSIRKSLERVLTPQEQFLALSEKIHHLHAMDMLTIDERNAALRKANDDMMRGNMERVQAAQEKMRAATIARSDAILSKMQEEFQARIEAIAANAVSGPAALERGTQEAFSAFRENQRQEQVAKDQLAVQKKMEGHLNELKRRGVVLSTAKLT